MAWVFGQQAFGLPLLVSMCFSFFGPEVQKAVDEMLKSFASDHDMYLRVGIASGPLCAGVVDGRSFRVPRRFDLEGRHGTFQDELSFAL